MWLFAQASSTFLYVWPVSVAMLILSVVALSLWLQQHQPRSRFLSATLFSGFAFTFAILLYGTLHAAGPEWWPKPSAWVAPYIVCGLLLAQVTTSIVFVARATRGTRLVLSVALMWELLLSLSVGFVALMSVSGQWL